MVAKIEDREIVEQVNQAEASHKVAEATIRQRQADLELAKTSVERSRNLYGRQLLPKQTLDDAEARYSAAQAQVDLAYAQLAQSASRLEELRINLGNTNVVSPVDGFVAKRNVDPGAWVSNQAGVASVVDISSLRLVANVVEKDLRMVSAGDPAVVEVDAFPGEKFNGKIARVSPILDPATRTAPMEIEIPNARLPAQARHVCQGHPRGRIEGERPARFRRWRWSTPKASAAIYQANGESRAAFKPVKIGIEDAERVGDSRRPHGRRNGRIHRRRRVAPQRPARDRRRQRRPGWSESWPRRARPGRPGARAAAGGEGGRGGQGAPGQGTPK